jgi:hypothetical protein
MNQHWAKPLHNRCTLHFGAVFCSKKLSIFSSLKWLEITELFRVVGEWLIGSDGWNRTTDLGVMNPTL